MTKRGKKSRVTIAGHNLTFAELTVLHQLKDYLATLRPTDKVLLRTVFHSRSKRYCARHLCEVGVLAAVGIEIIGFHVVVSKGQTV